MASYTSYMPSSRSPERGPSTSEGDDKTSPSSLDPNILQTLAEKRTTRDGNPPKKRGPKPNSKPAVSRRQELNRQAQRTHRLRKEGYIKALEDEVLRLKEVYSDSRQGREKLAEENKQLREALAQYGIPVGSPGSTASYAPGSSSTRTPPFSTQTTTPSIGSSGHASPGDRQQVSGHQLRDMTQQASGRGVDVEQAGIDFVLAYGNPPPSNSKAYLSSPPQ